MNVPFVKYHGSGNDFIMIDETIHRFELTETAIRFMCDRHFGIGGDGLIRLRKSTEADFEMLYYNSDGKIGSMCGNGGRCTVAFAHTLGVLIKAARFVASDGIHLAEIISTSPFVVKLKMNDVEKLERIGDDVFLNTGSPHYVHAVNDLSDMDVVARGRSVRYNDRFALEGTNVNFITIDNEDVHIRTYERGVEDETLSCGTGVVAAVLALVGTEKIKNNSPVNVHAIGGDLKVYFTFSSGSFSEIYLEGSAVAVFDGSITIS